MTETLEATFDGEVLRPDQPLRLPPNTRVRLTIESPELEPAPEGGSFFEVAESLNVDGPEDWSSRLEDYLYGPGEPDD